MKDVKMTRKGKLFVRLVEKIGFTILTTTLGLVAFFTGHPVIAFVMTFWACMETHGAFKAWWRYNEEPSIVIVKDLETDNLQTETDKKKV